MNQNRLLWVAALLIAIGALPFVSVAAASAILWANDCMGLDGATPCALYNTTSGTILANMLLAGWYVLISVPIGLVGVIILVVALVRKPKA